MATLEQVEKLKEKANVTYDEAKAALEACGDDLLEALIYLERQGKVASAQTGYYSTKLEVVDGSGAYEGAQDPRRGETFGDMMGRFWEWAKRVIHKGNTNNFEVWRHGQKVISLPVTVMVLLALFCFWVTIPLLVVGLFMSCKYVFAGPELQNSSVNDVMSSASQVADNLKQEVMNSRDNKNGEE